MLRWGDSSSLVAETETTLPSSIPEMGFLMACTIKALSRVGCRTDREGRENERKRKGKEGVDEGGGQRVG